MYPTIRDGETVTVKPVEADKVRRGDILLYRTASRMFAHRVVRIEVKSGRERVFTLRGDALSACDAPVSAEHILGRIVSVERKGREINLDGGSGGIRVGVKVRALRLRSGLSRGFGVLRVLGRAVGTKGNCGQPVERLKPYENE
jgi:hypothetical protein